MTHGFLWCAGLRGRASLSCEPLQLLLTARIAEDDVMPGAREHRPQLSTHQSRAENADAHVVSLSACLSSRAGSPGVNVPILSQSVVHGFKYAVQRDRPTGECCAFPS